MLSSHNGKPTQQPTIKNQHVDRQIREVGTNARGLAQSVRRWLRRRAYHKQLRRAKRAKSRARSNAANDLRMGKH
jgi:hypothetical protein